jgi:hypothetical protein
MRSFIVAIVVSAMVPLAFGADKAPPETPHLEFVTEYIRQLAAIEDVRAAGEQELKQGSQDDMFPIAIHNSTAMQLELKSQVRMLQGMRLAPPFEKLISTVTEFDGHKIELHQRLIDISSDFVGGPKPGVDYNKLAVEIPKIRAELEYLDRAIFEATPLVFATLIDQKPDSKNHASHLIITKAERARLLESLTNRFGSKLDQKEQNSIISAASVLKAYLLKDFKSSDEPWD